MHLPKQFTGLAAMAGILLFAACQPRGQIQGPGLPAPKTAYNKRLADSLGADEYGMRPYWLVLLLTGPAQITGKETVAALFKGHMDNINRMAKAGKLVVAGPFMGDTAGRRGLYIFKAGERKELDSLLQADPAISAGLLKTDIIKWYGSAALPMYLPYHDFVAAKTF